MDTDAPERSSTAVTLRSKYVKFCTDTDCAARRTFPLFPATIGKVLAYAIWLSDNNVNGWPSVRNYIAAMLSWSAELSFVDCRTATPLHEALYARFRRRFQSDVPIQKRRKSKLDMRPELLEAMALQTVFTCVISIKEMTAYVVLFFSSIRVGHVSPSRLDRSKHVLTWGDVILTEDDVFLFLHSTKTLRASAAQGWWTVLGARPQGHRALDPVRMMTLWRSLSYECDSQPVFCADTAKMLAQPRSAFTTALRRRLRQAVTILPRGHLCDVDRYAGISFRRAGVTQLWDKIPRHRLSARSQHSSFSSTAAYGGDSFYVRRGDTDTLASSFAPGF